MWCPNCQQDVTLPDDGGAEHARCGKCGQVLAGDKRNPLTPGPSPTKGEGRRGCLTPSSCPAREERSKFAVNPRLADDWELDADLRGVEQLLGTLKATSLGSRESAMLLPQAIPREADARRSSIHSHGTPSQDADRPKSHALAWCILAIGLATFACGAVLLGWSFAAERDDLWPLGLPLALVGQAGLIVGLMLQLDGLWQSSRQTSQTLTELDDELSRVRHATTLLTTTKNASAQSFYAHMAEGASPQLLLADLKGQLDLLAQQMASQRRKGA